MNEIPTAGFLKELAKEGLESYEQDVLKGPEFKKSLIKLKNPL